MMGVGDGVYDRNVSSASVPHELRTSAGDYKTPIGMDSAYVTAGLGDLLSNAQITKSGVPSDAWRFISSAVLGESNPDFGGAINNSAYGDAARMAGSASTAASNAVTAALGNSSAAARMFGGDLSKVGDKVQELGDKFGKTYGDTITGEVSDFWNGLFSDDLRTMKSFPE